MGILKKVYFAGGMHYDTPVAADDGMFAVNVWEPMGRWSIVGAHPRALPRPVHGPQAHAGAPRASRSHHRRDAGRLRARRRSLEDLAR